MATSGELIDIVARALGVARETVAVHLRNAREAKPKLIAQKGRGRGAATMTARDASRLLIAVAASPSTRDTVETIESFGRLSAFSEDLGLQQSLQDRYRDVESCVASEMEWIADQNNKGTLHFGYRRMLYPLYSDEAAITFHSVVGFGRKIFPKVVVVKRFLAPDMQMNDLPRDIRELTFASKGWKSLGMEPADLSYVMGHAPGLVQTIRVHFLAIAEIALAI